MPVSVSSINQGGPLGSSELPSDRRSMPAESLGRYFVAMGKYLEAMGMDCRKDERVLQCDHAMAVRYRCSEDDRYPSERGRLYDGTVRMTIILLSSGQLAAKATLIARTATPCSATRWKDG